jgi:hypothetical protein
VLNPEILPDPSSPPQGQEVAVDANIVIQILRNQIADLSWQNAILQAQLIAAKTSQEKQGKD